jgi:hypothetical protein
VIDAPRRSAEDILSRTVRVSLGGIEYPLRVRSIAANREWRQSLDLATRSFLADADEDDLAGLYDRLAAHADVLLDALLAYDTEGILPTAAEIEAIEPDATLDIVFAIREVWAAANPLLGISSQSSPASMLMSPFFPPSSSPPPSGDGDPDSSMVN